MSTTSPASEETAPSDADAHDEHGHHHDQPFMAHHFDTPEQQFDSGKLGMWIFLITEVMFFSGLFAAYAVYRGNHPEIFEYAHHFLNKTLGGINTAVLIVSSMSMAWAVRCAQLGQKKMLIGMLVTTLFCAALFLGVKTFEYTEKYEKRLLWSGAVTSAETIGRDPLVNVVTEEDQAKGISKVTPVPSGADFDERVEASLGYIKQLWILPGVVAVMMVVVGFWLDKGLVRSLGICGLTSVLGVVIGIQGGLAIHAAEHGGDHGGSHAAADSDHAGDEHTGDDHSGKSEDGEKHSDADGEHEGDEKSFAKDDKEQDHAKEEGGSEEEHAAEEHKEEHLADAGHGGHDAVSDIPRNMNIFFSIYYFMTGLHAFHIIGGMIAISWLIVRAFNGDFVPDYFGPVDYVGLYWHLVDLIWIYLFPLLYLINM